MTFVSLYLALSRFLHVWITARVPTPPEKSRILSPKISRTWRVLENEFGSVKSWKLKFQVLECLQSAAHTCEQFLQVQQIRFVSLGPLRHA